MHRTKKGDKFYTNFKRSNQQTNDQRQNLNKMKELVNNWVQDKWEQDNKNQVNDPLNALQQIQKWVQNSGLKDVKKTQMRKFYEIVSTLREQLAYESHEGMDINKVKRKLLKIIVIISYDMGRVGGVGSKLEPLKEVIQSAIDAIDSLEHVGNFFDLMEAIIAFHAEKAE